VKEEIKYPLRKSRWNQKYEYIVITQADREAEPSHYALTVFALCAMNAYKYR
jgi:hypothetical protein